MIQLGSSGHNGVTGQDSRSWGFVTAAQRSSVRASCSSGPSDLHNRIMKHRQKYQHYMCVSIFIPPLLICIWVHSFTTRHTCKSCGIAAHARSFLRNPPAFVSSLVGVGRVIYEVRDLAPKCASEMSLYASLRAARSFLFFLSLIIYPCHSSTWNPSQIHGRYSVAKKCP